MRIARIVVTMGSALALALTAASPAAAIPNPAGADDDLFTIHLMVPDPQLMTRTCAVSYTPTSNVTFTSSGVGVGVARERGNVKVASSGCPSVTWTSVVVVKDESPGHPTRTKVAAGGTTAGASQDVGYAIGVREAGLVTVTMIVSSRLGDFCWEDRYGVTAFGNPAPIASNLC